jgi:hypothetical protein
MMSSGARYPLSDARQRVERLLTLIAPYVERAEIAGSIRRCKPDVGDGEIVLIPSVGYLDALDRMVADGTLAKAVYGESRDKIGNMKPQHQWGDKLRGVVMDGMKIELWVTNAHSWGYIYWLRTGSADKNKWFMKALKFMDCPYTIREEAAARAQSLAAELKFMDCPYTIREGSVWHSDKRISVPDEAAFYALFGLPFINPEQRHDEALYRTAWNTARRAGSHAWGTPTYVDAIGVETPPHSLFDAPAVPMNSSTDRLAVPLSARIDGVVWTDKDRARYAQAMLADSQSIANGYCREAESLPDGADRDYLLAKARYFANGAEAPVSMREHVAALNAMAAAKEREATELSEGGSQWDVQQWGVLHLQIDYRRFARVQAARYRQRAKAARAKSVGGAA